MHCLTLAIPGLLWPRPVLRDTVFDLRLPAFEFLLGRARRGKLAAMTPEAWWCQRFSIAAPLPAAPMRLRALGHDPGDAEWLCADPVHLRLDRQGVALDDPAALQLDTNEAEALRATLAPLLADFGELRGDATNAWHLRLKVPAPRVAGSLAELLGRSAAALLPEGDAARPWRRALNEAQMALHAHSVNRAREASGKPAVNSLLLWGAGRLPLLAETGFTRLHSDDPVLRGLGHSAGIAVAETPARYAISADDAVVDWRALLLPTRQHDALAWREALQALESDWLRPALAALKRGDLRRLTLAGFGDSAALEIELTRGDLWCFWRRARALESLATESSPLDSGTVGIR